MEQIAHYILPKNILSFSHLANTNNSITLDNAETPTLPCTGNERLPRNMTLERLTTEESFSNANIIHPNHETSIRLNVPSQVTSNNKKYVPNCFNGSTSNCNLNSLSYKKVPTKKSTK